MFNCNDLEELLMAYLKDRYNCSNSIQIVAQQVQNDTIFFTYYFGETYESSHHYHEETGYTELILWYINNKDKL